MLGSELAVKAFETIVVLVVEPAPVAVKRTNPSSPVAFAGPAVPSFVPG